MSDHDRLIDTLSQTAGPVRRPLPTTLRAALWIALALPCGVAATSLLHHGRVDWSQPGAVWPMIALVLSFVLGALGIATAFDLGIAGRRAATWKLFLPLIGAWLAASLVEILISPNPIGHFGSGTFCYSFMTLASVPMIPLAVLALRRTRALDPDKALAVAGMGVAFMTSTLLTLCHSINAQLVDFLMHLAAAATIVVATVVVGRRWVAV